MYGKVFDSMYEGTLYGHWQSIVTLQQMLVLCNSEGVVDMTPQAISARTSIPLDIITKGIEVLSQPDQYSRTPGEEGRRIVLLDEHRPWGWFLVNYAKYQKIRNREEKLEADRVRIANKRKSNKITDVADSRKESQGVAEVAPTATATATAISKTTPLVADATLEQFEVAWKRYPKRSGSNPRADALQKWGMRIKEGVDPAVMLAGVDRYRAWCEAAEKIGTEYVMQAVRFFGRGRHFDEPYEIPKQGAGNGKFDPIRAGRELHERHLAEELAAKNVGGGAVSSVQPDLLAAIHGIVPGDKSD